MVYLNSLIKVNCNLFAKTVYSIKEKKLERNSFIENKAMPSK